MRRGSPAAPAPTRYYALAGHDTIMFYPTPGTADELTLYYVPKPSEMSTGTDDPSLDSFGGIPSEWHKAIELYALAEGADYSDDGSSGIGAAYSVRYEDFIRKMRGDLRRRGGTRLAPAIPNPRRSRSLTPSNPSQDLGY